MRFAHVLQRLDQASQRWKADHLMFGDFHRPLTPRRVNVYYWRPAIGDNVGDLISAVLVRKIVEAQGIDYDRPTPRTRKLFAIGSILEQAVPGATIWGSGLRHPILSPHGIGLDVRAVRGPLTRDALLHAGHACPEVYGDPAILLPRFYEAQPKVARAFLVVPHFMREKELLAAYSANAVSTLTSDWRGFIDAIAGAKLVVSGSLHGIILAEAYGVPAILLADAMDRDPFKYDDYYRSTGRDRYDVARTVDEALARGGQPLPSFEAARSGLLQSFPFGLWTS